MDTSTPKPSKRRAMFYSFNTHTPPDIRSMTRIIAVLGIENDDVAPDRSGWLLSDFFAYWHLLQGLTASQSWFHCLDLPAAVRKHIRFLQGPLPCTQRRVVFDASIADGCTCWDHEHGTKYTMCDTLYGKFHTTVQRECKAAEKMTGVTYWFSCLGLGMWRTTALFSVDLVIVSGGLSFSG